jgi:hypothetical protein
VGSDLSYKNYTRLECHAEDQHSGLFFPFVRYEEKVLGVLPLMNLELVSAFVGFNVKT